MTKKAWKLAFQWRFFYLGTCRQTFIIATAHGLLLPTLACLHRWLQTQHFNLDYYFYIIIIELCIFQTGFREPHTEGSCTSGEKRVIYDLSCVLFSVPRASTTAAIALFSDTYTRRYGVTGVYLSPEGTCWDFQAFTSRNKELDWGHTDSDRRGGRVLRKHIPETGRCLDQDLNSEAPGHSALILDVLFNSTQFSHTQKSKGFLEHVQFCCM